MDVSLANAPMDVGATTRRAIATYTGPASYPAGGDPVTPEDVRMGKVFAIAGAHAINGATLYHLCLNGAAGSSQTIRWYLANGTEVTPGVDLSGAAGQVEFIGQ